MNSESDTPDPRHPADQNNPSRRKQRKRRVDDLDVDRILGSDGRIAKRLERYEARQSQLAMARKVYQALEKETNLVVEAGTGTGKSFAYLVPAILFATDPANHIQLPTEKGKKPKTRSRRILISTHTIALQEQLIGKDIPFLNAVIPREFSAVLCKGRGNYLSLRRLKRAREKQVSLFSGERKFEQLRAIGQWAGTTTDGSRSTLPIRPDGDVWEQVASDTGNCFGKRCPTREQCFYFAARARAQNAQLLVVNHALFFTDLALRREGVSILPPYDAVILDECHTIESVAGDHLGLRISNSQIDYQFDRLYNDSTNKGVLVTIESTELQKLVSRCRFASSDFFSAILDWTESSPVSNGRVHEKRIVENNLSPILQQLARGLTEASEVTEGAATKKDLRSASERITVLADGIHQWLEQTDSSCVFWIEDGGSRRSGMDRVDLISAPINIGNALRETLYQDDSIRSVIMTSATLETKSDGKFQFFRSRIGMTDGMNLQVGSPFEYDKQSKLVLVTDMPDPTQDRVAFENALPAQIKRFAGHSGGATFVLFTSYDLLRRCADAVTPWALENGMQLFIQGGDLNRSQLLDAFKASDRGVLFGTDSFWQGVDVPGDDLTNVIITRLPFAVPDHPLLQARLEAIRSSGENPFLRYQLPEAIIKFRQGFGRLIRTRDDRGIVPILDPRIKSKFYGRQFIDALPKMPVVEVSMKRRQR